MKILIFDPVGGASGDMILGSLIHLGCPAEHINGILSSLPLPEIKNKNLINFSIDTGSAISAARISFAVGPARHHARSYGDIKKLIDGADFADSIKNRALCIFSILAEVESRIHSTSIEDVHFHEIGALDSIFDIVGIAAAVDWFAPDAIWYRRIPLGQGTTASMHGIIPVPAPATVRLLEGMKVRFTGVEGELTTPTGAAVLRALASASEPPADCTIIGSGYGTGTKKFESWPNLFRSILCETTDTAAEEIFIAEADVDDMNPEDWEAALTRIIDAGALDANLTSRIMKRGRPGVGIKVVAPAGRLHDIISQILLHTASIGVRYYPVSRTTLKRREYRIKTEYGEIGVKETILPDGTTRRKPEYRDLDRLAKENNISIEALKKKIGPLLGNE